MTKKNSPVKIIISMMFISIIGKILGLVREILFAKNFGTDNIFGTAFTYASNIPNQFLDIMLASAIGSSFIPVFNTELEKKNKDAAFDLFNNFLSIIILLTGIVVLISSIFSYEIIDFLAAGLNNKTKLIASVLLKIMLPVLMFSGATFLTTGVLQSFGEFNIPSAMSIFFNGIIIFYYIFFIKRFGVYGLAISLVIGWLAQLIIQLPFLFNNNYRFRFKINLRDKRLHEILKLMLPVLISSWVVPINNMINANTASYISGGGNALRMANTVYIIITGTFVLSVNNFMFQKLSKLKANNSNKEFDLALNNSIGNIFYFLVPLMAILIIFNKEIISILFERGSFDANSTALTSKALFFYSIGIIGYGLQTILNSSFYANKNAKTPLIASLLAIFINFILSDWLKNYLGIGGPALASSIAINFSALFMFCVINKSKAIINKKFCFSLLKIFLSALIMSCFILVFYKLVFINFINNKLAKFMALFFLCFSGGLIYLILSCLLNLDQAVFMKTKLKSFLVSKK